MQDRKRHRCIEPTFGLCGRVRVRWSEGIVLKHVYYQVWNRSPAQVGCMRQMLGAGALGRPRGMGWRGRWEGGSGWGTHVNPWLIHVNVWQKPLQYCKVTSLQLIKINEKKRIIKYILFISKRKKISLSTSFYRREDWGRERINSLPKAQWQLWLELTSVPSVWHQALRSGQPEVASGKPSSRRSRNWTVQKQKMIEKS